MLLNHRRLKNRILQTLYRPKVRTGFISAEALSFLDELETVLEEKISPLLEDFF